MDTYSTLFAKVLSYISYRPRSEFEIRSYCRKTALALHAEVSTIEAVMTRVGELGYINDIQYARMFFHDRMVIHGKGERVIRLQLRAKGISESVIDAVIVEQTVENPDERIDLMKKAIDRKLLTWCVLPYRECKQKVYGYLLRHGYIQKDIDTFIDSYLKNQYNNG